MAHVMCMIQCCGVVVIYFYGTPDLLRLARQVITLEALLRSAQGRHIHRDYVLVASNLLVPAEA